MSAPAIFHLGIERFRGIKTLSWHPAKGVNVILGGGDVGKTTILDAIGLLIMRRLYTLIFELSESVRGGRSRDAT